MAWTATFLGSVKRDGNLNYSIVYTDGARRIVRFYITPRLDDDLVKQVAMTEVATLASADDDAVRMTLVAGSQIDLTPIVPPDPPPPTQDELDKKTFLSNYARWKQLKVAVDNGWLQQNDAEFTGLTATLKSSYKRGYGVS